MRNLTDEEAEIYDQRLNAEATEINNRVDDAFIELETQRNRLAGITKDISEHRKEIIETENKLGKYILWTKCLIAAMVMIWSLVFIILSQM